MNIDWGLVWQFLWPVAREALIALLMALLALLGYDRGVPSRYERKAIRWAKEAGTGKK